MEMCYICYWYNSLTDMKVCKQVPRKCIRCPEPMLELLRYVDYKDWINRKRKGLINHCLLAHFDEKQTNLSEFL